MNTLITGSAYVEALSAADDDRLCRAAFLELALQLAPPRAVLFDFGCGPGLDARVYAEHGHQVCAFDVDPDMCAYFREACARDLAADRVRLIDCSYQEFLDSPALLFPRVDLITANFAPLNLVARPAALFAKFATLLKPGGRVLASVLNPWHRGDLRYAWWWRGLPQLLARGRFHVPGAQAPITRWLPARLAREAGASFECEAIHVAPVRAPAAACPVRWRSALSWPAIAASRYLFLSLRRTRTP